MTSLTILLAVMGGLRQKSRDEDMGANVFVILPGEKTEVIDGELNLDKREMLSASLDSTSVAAARTYSLRVANFAQPVRVFAVEDAYFSIHDTSPSAGRLLDDFDHTRAARVAVVSDTLAYEANWQLGQSIYLGQALFTIVGIIERPGTALEKETSDKSFVPDDTVDLIEVKAKGSSELEATVAAARRLLVGRSDTDPYTWITPASILKNVTRLEQIIGLTAGSVAILCLVLGGTTLMSLMVANVRDRILEIALRQTIGATPREIAALFVVESCIVTLCGSIVGISFALILISLSSGHFTLPIHLGPGGVLIPLLTAVAMGMCFSYLPAKMAMAITPAEALRND
jgi:ABC-type antimicrobial peptide transport system permease subunit